MLRAPGAGAGGWGPCEGPPQIREGAVQKRLWGSVVHRCTFPSISSCCHPANTSLIVPVRLRKKHVRIAAKYYKCLQINGRICFYQLSAVLNYFKAYAQVSKLSFHAAYIKQYVAHIYIYLFIYRPPTLACQSSVGKKTNYFS